MSAQQGCNDDKAVVESFKEALKQRIGADPFRMWFSHEVTFAVGNQRHESASVQSPATVRSGEPEMFVRVRGQFALDRLRKNFISEMRAAAMQVFGTRASVHLQLETAEAVQAELPLDPPVDSSASGQSSSATSTAHGAPERSKTDAVPCVETGREPATRPRPATGDTRSLTALAKGRSLVGPKSPHSAPKRDRLATTESRSQPSLPNLEADAGRDRAQASESDGHPSVVAMTASTFVPGPCNQLAHTAMTMVCQSPGVASPLFLCGPSGTGKTHLLSSIADQLRRRHRMRRVIHLSAEQFTNDFITSVGNSGIASFRRRYRDVDALLIDDVQFLGSKRATLREMLYTVETLSAAGRPLVFSGSQSPTEIPGLTRELAGRMAAGLLCPMQPLDQTTRETLLRRAFEQRCQIEVPESIIAAINPSILGDGRVISGLANLLNTLQRMFGRMPTMDEIRQFGGDLLRAAKPVATLTAIESAVCQTFHLPDASLRAPSQTRAVSEPRMLAMHLSRQLTTAAYAEIGSHFGGRSHSTAIAAGKNVRTWLQQGKSIGRGVCAITAQEAIDRIESLLRSG